MKKAIIRLDVSDNEIGQMAKVILPCFPEGTFIQATVEEEPSPFKVIGDFIASTNEDKGDAE